MKPFLSRRSFMSDATTSAVGVAVSSVLAPHISFGQERSKIRVGQIGTAHAHAAGKLETFRKLSEVYEVVGVVESDPLRRAAAEKVKAYAGVRWMSERELFESEGLECVAVETEIEELVPTAQRCIDAGFHIHLDKPAGESLAALQVLHQSAESKRLCIQMGYMFRYNPAFVLAARAVHHGWLGEVFELHAVMSKKVGQGERDQLRKYAGGSMFELGCHLIDAMVWMLGAPSSTSPFIRRTTEDGLADNMLVTFEYPKATATIRSSVVEPFGGRRRQFTVVGTEGVIDIRPLEPPRLELTLDRPRDNFKAGTQVVELQASVGRYDHDLLDLAEVVRGKKQLQWSASHDLATHEAILRASGLVA